MNNMNNMNNVIAPTFSAKQIGTHIPHAVYLSSKEMHETGLLVIKSDDFLDIVKKHLRNLKSPMASLCGKNEVSAAIKQLEAEAVANGKDILVTIRRGKGGGVALGYAHNKGKASSTKDEIVLKLAARGISAISGHFLGVAVKCYRAYVTAGLDSKQAFDMLANDLSKIAEKIHYSELSEDESPAEENNALALADSPVVEGSSSGIEDNDALSDSSSVEEDSFSEADLL